MPNILFKQMSWLLTLRVRWTKVTQTHCKKKASIYHVEQHNNIPPDNDGTDHESFEP